MYLQHRAAETLLTGVDDELLSRREVLAAGDAAAAKVGHHQVPAQPNLDSAVFNNKTRKNIVAATYRILFVADSVVLGKGVVQEPLGVLICLGLVERTEQDQRHLPATVSNVLTSNISSKARGRP